MMEHIRDEDKLNTLFAKELLKRFTEDDVFYIWHLIENICPNCWNTFDDCHCADDS